MKNLLFIAILASTSCWATYQEHFPQYFEYCAVTQLKYQKEYFNGAEGGAGGHGFIYIHGLCKDYTKNYPQVVPCSESGLSQPSKYFHEGVGVSLDNDFSNVSWVAVPGRDFFLFGDKERKKVTDADVEEVSKRATDLRIFENVKLKAESVAKEEFNSPAQQLAAAKFAIGTDLAINWARDMRCIKVPVNQKAIEQAAAYLNNLNDSYYQKGKEYKWTVEGNNCTHFAINASNAMGLNKAIKTDQPKLLQLFSLAIPSNAYLNYVDKLVRGKVSIGKLKRSKTLDKLDFHQVQLGTLLAKYDAFPENAMFKTDNLKAITLPRKNIFRMFATPQSYDRYIEDPKNSNLKANAKMWVETYEKLLDQAQRQGESPEIIEYLKQQLAHAHEIAQD